MSKFKFVLNRSGVSDLMKGEAMQAVLRAKAKVVQNRCGDGFDASLYVFKKRAVSSVRASSSRARRRNLKENTLLKALK